MKRREVALLDYSQTLTRPFTPLFSVASKLFDQNNNLHLLTQENVCFFFFRQFLLHVIDVIQSLINFIINKLLFTGVQHKTGEQNKIDLFRASDDRSFCYVGTRRIGPGEPLLGRPRTNNLCTYGCVIFDDLWIWQPLIETASFISTWLRGYHSTRNEQC